MKHQAATQTAADPVSDSSSAKSRSSGFSFKRSSRLLDGAAYGQVFKRNYRVTSQYWIVLGHRTRDNNSRLGLAIAKKRAKRAVDRNKLKRVARESFRHQRKALTGLDIVVMNKDPAKNAPTVQLRESLDKLWAELLGKIRVR